MSDPPPRDDNADIPTIAPDELDEHLDRALQTTAGATLAPGGRELGPGETGEVSRLEPGRYLVEGEVGRGGLGRVLLAYDAHVGRRVAIKELLPATGAAPGGPSGPPRISAADLRFLREARVTGQLEHPSILPVYEIGRRDDGSLYYSMRLVRGRSLAQAIQETGSLRERLHLLPHFLDLCHALAYAHDRGVIHRDLKPDNVMIGEFGETVLLDWGLAKVLGDPGGAEAETAGASGRLEGLDSARTVAGVAFGTPQYMPPEQARGSAELVDHRSDIYSLGAILFHLLTGRPPFDGSDAAAVVRQVLTASPPRVVSLAPEAPPELVAVAEKALAKAPKRRYQSGSELAAEIEAYMSGERVSAYQYGALELIRLFVRKHKAAVAAALVVLLAILATAIATSISYASEREAREDEAAARRAAETASVELERTAAEEARERRKAQFHLAQAFREKAVLMEREQRYPAARIYAAASLLNNPAHEPSPAYAAGFADDHPESLDARARAVSAIYRADREPSLRLVRTIAAAPEETWLAISAAGGLLAAVVDSGVIRIASLDTGRTVLSMSGHRGQVRSIAFSPDGAEFVSGGQDGTVRLWGSRTGIIRKTIALEDTQPMAVAFSPRGDLFAASDRRGDTHLFRASDGSRAGRLSGRGAPTFRLGWSGDGRYLAIVGWDKTLRVWDVAADRAVELPAPQLGFHEASFSPDGQTLVTADWGRGIALWRVGSWTPLTDLVGHHGAVYGFGFSADGKHLVSGGFDRRVVLWDLLSGERLVAIEPHRERIRELDFLPGGERFVTLSWDHTVSVWEIVPGQPPVIARGREQHVTAVALSPDGRTFAAGSDSGAVRIRDRGSGGELRALAGHSARVHTLDFSPDGQRLATAAWDNTARVWDAVSGEPVVAPIEHGERVNGVSFSPDGELLATADSGGAVRVFDARTGEGRLRIDADESRAWNVDWSPDGRLLASVGSDPVVKLWNAESGELELRLEGHADWVSGIAFSSDGKLLASSGRDGVAIVWDLRSRRELYRLSDHEVWVNTVRFGKGDGLLVTSSDDRTARLWSVATGEPLLVLSAEAALETVDISRDGRHLLLGEGANAVIYPVDLGGLRRDPRELLRRAEQAVGLELQGFEAVPAHRAQD